MTRRTMAYSNLLVVPWRGTPVDVWREALGLGPEWMVVREGDALLGWHFQRAVVLPPTETQSVTVLEAREQWWDNLRTKADKVVFL